MGDWVTVNIIATQQWRYVNNYLKAPGRVDRLVGGAVVTDPGGGTSPDGFVLGTTKPDSTNAGLPAGWAPKQTVTSQVDVTTGGQLFEDIRFDCAVNLQSTGNTFRRCQFRGLNSAMGRPMVWAINAGCNVGPQNVFEFCEFAPQYVSNKNDCLQGYNYRSYRCEYFHGVDTSGTYIPPSIGSSLRVTRQGDYLHDQAYFCPDTGGQSNGYTHNDGNQHANGVGESWEGCNMSGYWAPDVGVGVLDSGVFHLAADGKTRIWDSGNSNSPGVANGPRQCNASFEMNVVTGGTADDFTWTNNWIYGGSSTWNCLDTKISIQKMVITGNRIEIPRYGKGAILNCYSAASAIVTASGNTLMDGTPISLTVGDGRTNKT